MEDEGVARAILGHRIEKLAVAAPAGSAWNRLHAHL
jgi:hypothetical protein